MKLNKQMKVFCLRVRGKIKLLNSKDELSKIIERFNKSSIDTKKRL